jgi:hypothetical protein
VTRLLRALDPQHSRKEAAIAANPRRLAEPRQRLRLFATTHPVLPFRTTVTSSTGPGPKGMVVGESCHASLLTLLVSIWTPEFAPVKTAVTSPAEASTSVTLEPAAAPGRVDGAQCAPPSCVSHKLGPYTQPFFASLKRILLTS